MNRDKKTIKTYFETGDVPTQQQYEDLIDSYIDSKQLPGEPNRRFVIDENGYVRVLSEIKQSNYSLSEINGNKIALLKDGVVINEIDLSAYVDNINLSRLVSGSLDVNGVTTFRRNDNSFFRVDFSSLINSDKLIVKDPSSPEGIKNYWKGSNDQLATISAKNNDTLYFAKEEKSRVFEANILPIFPNNPSALSIGDSYFSGDGKKLFISHTKNAREEYIIRELLLSVAYDVSTAKATGVELDLIQFKELSTSAVSRWSLSNDGTKLFFVDTKGATTFDDTLKVLNLKVPFDITTGILDPNNKLALTQFGGAGYVFSPDGKQLIMRRDAGFFQYTLENSYDLPTAKQVFYGQVNPILGTFGSAMGNPKFSNDGKRLFFPLTGFVGITEFHLTTPYDFSTVTKKGQLASRDVLGFVFNKDGTELSSITNPPNFTGTTSFNYQFNRYKLALPFDVLSTKGVGGVDMYLGDVKIDSEPKKDSYSLSVSNDTRTVNLLENGSVISKVDISSLIEVSKPVQSDYAQTDVNSSDYIKNKPEIGKSIVYTPKVFLSSISETIPVLTAQNNTYSIIGDYMIIDVSISNINTPLTKFIRVSLPEGYLVKQETFSQLRAFAVGRSANSVINGDTSEIQLHPVEGLDRISLSSSFSFQFDSSTSPNALMFSVMFKYEEGFYDESTSG